MIPHLEMNVTQNLNFSPYEGVVSSYFIPHIILSQMNWNYIKHFKVEFGAYVQASQVNAPKNKNILSTLDGIYLFPVPNFQ